MEVEHNTEANLFMAVVKQLTMLVKHQWHMSTLQCINTTTVVKLPVNQDGEQGEILELINQMTFWIKIKELLNKLRIGVKTKTLNLILEDGDKVVAILLEANKT